LLGPVDVSRFLEPAEVPAFDGGWETRFEHLDWVIVGGESGPQHRAMDVEWARTIVEQCREAGVACFVKQDSGLRPGQQGRLPDDLWAVKEWPQVEGVGQASLL
jgi:protein gp37